MTPLDAARVNRTIFHNHGKFVELMSYKVQESSSSRDGDIITSRLSPKVRLGWLAPPAEVCLAVYLHEKSFSVSRALAAHVTAPLSSGRAARSRRKSQLGYFCSGRLLGCLEIQYGHKQL